jgi:hypothetical protein
MAAFHCRPPTFPNSPTCDAPTVQIDRQDTPAPETSWEDFDWRTRQSVVVQEQQAIPIYHNPVGNLVIRQERSWSDDQDSFILIHPSNNDLLLDKLCDVAGIPSVGRQ